MQHLTPTRPDAHPPRQAITRGRLAHRGRAIPLLEVSLDLLVVRLAARRARPAVACLGLGRKRRVDAREVEDARAACTGDGLGPVGGATWKVVSRVAGREGDEEDALGGPLAAHAAATLGVAQLGGRADLAQDKLKVVIQVADDLGCVVGRAKRSASEHWRRCGGGGGRDARGAFETL